MPRSTGLVAAARPLIAHLRAGRLVFDLIVLTGVGLIVSLVVFLASLTFVDSVVFQFGLHYASTTSQAAPDEVGFDVVPNVAVARGGSSGGPGAVHSDYEHSINVTAWMYPDGTDRAGLTSLFGHDLLRGDPAQPGVVLDEATARHLDVPVGTTVWLDQAGKDGLTECGVPVSAIVRAYRDPRNDMATGLAVVSDAACPAVSSATSRAVSYSFTPIGAAGWMTRGEMVRQTIGIAGQQQNSGLMVPLLILGLGLWALMAWRVAARFRGQLLSSAQILHILGVPWRGVRAVSGAGFFVLGGLACLGSFVLAHWLLFAVTGLWTQWLHVMALWVAGLLVVGLVTLLVFRGTRWATMDVEL